MTTTTKMSFVEVRDSAWKLINDTNEAFEDPITVAYGAQGYIADEYNKRLQAFWLNSGWDYHEFINEVSRRTSPKFAMVFFGLDPEF